MLAPGYIKYPDKSMLAGTAFIVSFEIKTVRSAIEMFYTEPTICNIVAQTLGVEYSVVKDFLRTPTCKVDALTDRVNELLSGERKESRVQMLVDLI
jgi:hypothetical protein